MPTTMSFLSVLDALVVLVAWFVHLRVGRRQRNPAGYPLPPGPRPSIIPFIGSLRDMPTSEEWITFTKWSRDYGPVIMIELLGKKMCILNTTKAANDLLDKRSEIYSDRPVMPMINDLMGWDFNLGFQPYGPKWKKHRNAINRGFNHRVSDSYQPIQMREVTLLLKKIIEGPNQYEDHLHEASGAIVMMATYGYTISGRDDPFVRVAEDAQYALSAAVRPGAYLVDIFPILKYVPEWIPGAGFQRYARNGRMLAQELFEKPFEWAMKEWEDGNARPSFFTTLMESQDQDAGGNDAVVTQSVSAVMYSAGVETTYSAILNLILAMLHNPNVQRKAQEELDRVVGTDRLPTFADRESLPYVTAIAKESLRWESVTPLGLAHCSTHDDVYDGYFIPAGTTMIPNQWAMSHDETMYPDPMAFKPERFLDPSHQVRDPNTIAFGWGRRICPGKFVAENSLWLHAAALLACFDIQPAKDKNGLPIIPPRQFASGLVAKLEHFPCLFVPRSAKTAEVIELSVTALR